MTRPVYGCVAGCGYWHGMRHGHTLLWWTEAFILALDLEPDEEVTEEEEEQEDEEEANETEEGAELEGEEDKEEVTDNSR